MKSNVKFIADNQAQAGIGTLIIYIAIILIAAVAAAVIINTQGILQQKSAKTGSEAIGEVTSNIQFVSLVGNRGDTSNNNFTFLNVTIKPSAGTGDIDIKQVRISLTDGSHSRNFCYDQTSLGNTGSACDTTFSTRFLRDPDTSNTTMNQGDLVMLTMDTSSGWNFQARAYYKVVLTPEIGNPVQLEGYSPPTYGVKQEITLK